MYDPEFSTTEVKEEELAADQEMTEEETNEAETDAINRERDAMVYTAKRMDSSVYLDSSRKCTNCRELIIEHWYRSLKPRDITLCMSCFSEGIFPSFMNSHDFVKLACLRSNSQDEEVDDLLSDLKLPAKQFPQSGTEWTDEKKLHLLECVDMYGADWHLISEYVGRSPEDCLRAFLDMDIKIEEPIKSLKDMFSGFENPAMACISLVTRAFDEGVGANAARAALRVFFEKNQDLKPRQVLGQSEMFEAVIMSIEKDVKDMINTEEELLEKYIRRLVDLQMRLCELKMNLLADVTAKC